MIHSNYCCDCHTKSPSACIFLLITLLINYLFILFSCHLFSGLLILIRSLTGQDFSLCNNVKSGDHPAYPIGISVLSPGGKWSGHEANRSPPSITKIRNAWSCTSTSPYTCMTWYLSKHRRQLYIYFYQTLLYTFQLFLLNLVFSNLHMGFSQPFCI
jgi:hypothetical protein